MGFLRFVWGVISTCLGVVWWFAPFALWLVGEYCLPALRISAFLPAPPADYPIPMLGVYLHGPALPTFVSVSENDWPALKVALVIQGLVALIWVISETMLIARKTQRIRFMVLDSVLGALLTLLFFGLAMWYLALGELSFAMIIPSIAAITDMVLTIALMAANLVARIENVPAATSEK